MAGDMERSPDEFGYALTFRVVGALPKRAIALVDILDDERQPLASRDPVYADSAGRFVNSGEIHGQLCRGYVPFGAVEYPSTGTYQVRLRCVSYDPESREVHGHGFVRFQIDLPPPPESFSRIELGRPLVWLGMSMARADNLLGPEEMRRLLDIASDALGMGPTDIPALRRVMTERHSLSLEQLVDTVIARMAQSTHDHIMAFLAQLAWADDNIDEGELEVLRDVARHLNLDKDQWRALERRHKLRV